MYYYVKGELALLESDRAVIDCGGVGYLLSITKNTYDELVSGGALTASGDAAEKTVKLFTYYHVREDAAELYGFFTENECSLFKLLIGVSGVGPKAALSVLSALSPSSFIAAVLSDDAKAVSKAQGVGLKSAQKIILELKDKLVVVERVRRGYVYRRTGGNGKFRRRKRSRRSSYRARIHKKRGACRRKTSKRRLGGGAYPVGAGKSCVIYPQV